MFLTGLYNGVVSHHQANLTTDNFVEARISLKREYQRCWFSSCYCSIGTSCFNRRWRCL